MTVSAPGGYAANPMACAGLEKTAWMEQFENEVLKELWLLSYYVCVRPL